MTVKIGLVYDIPVDGEVGSIVDECLFLREAQVIMSFGKNVFSQVSIH
jgi:hypothetical protein